MPKASNGMARLHEAWNIGDKHAFEAALAVFEQQSGPSETDKNGRTALWLAASIGSVKVGLIRFGGHLSKQVKVVHGSGAEESETAAADVHG